MLLLVRDDYPSDSQQRAVRKVFSMSNDTNEKDIKFAERTKPSRGDAQPEPAAETSPAPAPNPQRLQLRPFTDGIVLRHSINPRNPATYVIHDATGTPLAVALHAEFAELVCKAVTFLFFEQDRLQKKAQADLDALSSGIEPETAQEAKPFVPVVAEPLPKSDDVTDAPAENP
jgi:hypothetical protein